MFSFKNSLFTSLLNIEPSAITNGMYIFAYTFLNVLYIRIHTYIYLILYIYICIHIYIYDMIYMFLCVSTAHNLTPTSAGNPSKFIRELSFPSRTHERP